jgi:hypothetical protein
VAGKPFWPNQLIAVKSQKYPSGTTPYRVGCGLNINYYGRLKRLARGKDTDSLFLSVIKKRNKLQDFDKKFLILW